MANTLSKTFPKKSTPDLPWPPPERGVSVHVCESPLASYSIGVGLSRWNLVDPHPWIYFRPERRERGRAFGDLYGEVGRLTLFRGINGAARVQAQAIFERLCADLQKRAKEENSRQGVAR